MRASTIDRGDDEEALLRVASFNEFDLTSCTIDDAASVIYGRGIFCSEL